MINVSKKKNTRRIINQRNQKNNKIKKVRRNPTNRALKNKIKNQSKIMSKEQGRRLRKNIN